MATPTAGRGRGRGILKFVEPKPGQQVSATTEDSRTIERFAAVIDALSLEPDRYEVPLVQDMLAKTAIDADKMTACVQTIFKRCENDWHFAKSAVHCIKSCFGLEALKSVQGPSLRAVYLKMLQSLYKEKDTIHAEVPPKRWLCCVALMCQTLVQCPLDDGSPMAPLIEPVFDVLENCFSASASVEELNCASVQLHNIGPYLSKYCSGARLTALQNQVRDRITNGSGTKETRLMLIEVIEGFVSNWQ